MTSTDIYQGMDVGSKTSSRVLNPPGGRSNNIFGTAEEKSAPARQKPAQSSNVQIGAPAQSAKPKCDSSSFSTLGFGTGDSAADVAAQRSANQKRNQASTFMFGGEDNSACAPQQKVNPPANVPMPSSTVESPASNCSKSKFQLFKFMCDLFPIIFM
ncbi:jupiter microtubule associated homolog 1-like [Anneissia japonica]|uniref:jupiter microtubule associated homolog 1-like n=1 Tax=Anneissia japonica TaxID=1529436 RepID=UPI0014257686|nr:jupiter microtubule associated homolog 1-like [Anneissia japonica]